MPTRDNTSGQKVIEVFNENIGNDTPVTTTTVVDTVNFDLGIMFAFALVEHNNGSFAVTISESDDSGMSGATLVPADKIIGTLPTGVAAVPGPNGQWKVFGIHSTKRFVQLTVTGTGVSISTTVLINAIARSNTPPVPRT